MFTRDQRGAVVGVDLAGRLFTRVPAASGVVVVVFVQVFPEAKRLQFKQVLDAYEAGPRYQARAGSEQASGDDEAPTAR